MSIVIGSRTLVSLVKNVRSSGGLVFRTHNEVASCTPNRKILCRRGITTMSTLQGPLLGVDESPKANMNTSNLITIPVHLKNRLDRKLARESPEKRRVKKFISASRAGNKSQVILQARKPAQNHYLGQSYARNEEIPLVSKGWRHHKAAGDWFVLRPVKKSVEYGFCEGSPNTFEDLIASPELVARLKENKAMKPTHIQEIAIPEIMKGYNNLITAETGCGKTLAYLIPVVQQILLQKRGRRHRGVNQPLAVILVPSRELADQIHYVACKLTEGMNIDTFILQGGNIGSKISSPRMSNVDLMISTIHAARELSSAGVFDMRHVEHVVLDEADTLLDDSFVDDIVSLLRRFPFEPSLEAANSVQMTLVSATLPRSVETVLEEIIPVESLNRISTPEVHCLMPHVTQTFLRMKKSHKPDQVLKVLRPEIEKKIPVMIFCNKVETCSWMYHHLSGNGIRCVVLHGETKPAFRKGILSKYHNGDVDVIVCSDLGSRGIDTTRTGHVINYDFPTFLANYVHRCGRTGRVGSRGGGKITNFVAGRLEVEVVQEIEKSIRKEIALSKVNANIKRLITDHYGMFKPILPSEETQ